MVEWFGGNKNNSDFGMVSFGSAPSRLTDLGNWADVRCSVVGLSKIYPRTETKIKVEIHHSASFQCTRNSISQPDRP